jgi:hypothetical protein
MRAWRCAFPAMLFGWLVVLGFFLGAGDSYSVITGYERVRFCRRGHLVCVLRYLTIYQLNN